MKKGLYNLDNNPYYIAYEIDNGNQEVIDLIKKCIILLKIRDRSNLLYFSSYLYF